VLLFSTQDVHAPRKLLLTLDKKALAAMSRRMAQSVFSLYSQYRSITGMSMPSSKSLWDIIKREHIEKHNAAEVRDIWQEVSSSLAGSRDDSSSPSGHPQALVLSRVSTNCVLLAVPCRPCQAASGHHAHGAAVHTVC
jgi:hypothetical protein